MTIKTLWKERFFGFLKEITRYLRYILNGHLLLVLFFMFAGAAVYYQEWITGLSSDFQVGIVVGVIVGLVVTISPTLTYLKEADQVFWITAERKLGSYFIKSFLVSFTMNVYLVLMVFGFCVPMIKQVSGSSVNVSAVFMLLIFVKFANQLAQFGNNYSSIMSVFDKLFRFFINFTIIYFVFEPGLKIVGYAALVALIAFAVYNFLKIKNSPLPWIKLIENDQNTMNRFYNLANLFVDVPHLQNKVRKRKWLNLFMSKVTYSKKDAYKFLTSRTFFRSNDYFGLYLRLTLIGVVILWFGDLGYWSVAVACIFTYLTVFQITPIISHHEWNVMARIYPIDRKVKINSSTKFLWNIIIVQLVAFSVVAALVASNLWMCFVVMLPAGFVAFLLVRSAQKKVMKKGVSY